MTKLLPAVALKTVLVRSIFGQRVGLLNQVGFRVYLFNLVSLSVTHERVCAPEAGRVEVEGVREETVLLCQELVC